VYRAQAGGPNRKFQFNTANALKGQWYSALSTLPGNTLPRSSTGHWRSLRLLLRGLTGASEHWIVKCIVGRRFKF
jgi:hypothetical protein